MTAAGSGVACHLRRPRAKARWPRTARPARDRSPNRRTTDHLPGALYRALGVFDQNHINLTKLESRQVRGRPFEYQFIIDIIANQQELISLIHELEQLDYSVRLLGHYKISRPAINVD